MAYLELLGSPRARVGEDWLDIPAEKPALLLVYLALQSDWLDRSELAHIVRPDADEKTARHNLRLLLHRARKLSWAEGLEVEGTRVRWCVHTDVQQFRAAMAQQDWAEAVALHKADLLTGMNLIDMPEIQSWTELERETLLAAWREAVTHHAAELEDAGNHALAAGVLKRVLQRDSLAEEVVQAYLRAAYLGGQREQALAAFEAFKGELEREMGLEPLELTLNLIHAIRDGRPLGPELEPVKSARRTAYSNLPSQPTAFIGRERELGNISDKLADPACRLLTLIGPGGIGKTRLALQAAARQLSHYPHGVCLVPLAPLESADSLVPAVAEALRLSFYGHEAQRTQLLNYLREKELLLLIDNFEHLLGGADLLADILEHAPQVTILATSRERLNLQGEWLVAVDGLPVPARDDTNIDGFDAVQLFMQSAQQVQQDFSASDRACVAHICRLVEGIPLGLELAASWAHVIPCDEIATELEDNLDFLQTSLTNVPERHRSMRAVFDYSWQLLSKGEREVFSKLAVFRGGFSRDAAAEVASATLPVLAGLVNKSFLHLGPAGRYDVHELLRQYARDKLAAMLDELEKTRALHSHYFASLVAEQEEALHGKWQREALEKISQDIENVRLAWRWAVEQRQETTIRTCLEGLRRFYTMRSWNQEGLEAFQTALQRWHVSHQESAPVTADNLLVGRLLLAMGHFNIGLGRYGEAKELLDRSLNIFASPDAEIYRARALRYLGQVAWKQVNYAEANDLLQKSADLLKGTDHQHAYALSLVDLGINAQHLGNLSAAQQLFGEALAVPDAAEDAWLVANLQTARGNVERALGNYQEAKRLYNASLVIKKALEHPFGVAACLINLGVIAEMLGAYAEARTYYQEGFDGFREIGYRQGMALALHNQAIVSRYLDNHDDAEGLFEESLGIYRDIGAKQGITAALRGLGLVALVKGEPNMALGRFAESLELARDIGYRRGMAVALLGLGEASTALDKVAAARKHFLEALEVATESGLKPVMLESMLGLAKVLSRRAEVEQTTQLLALVLEHPASEKHTRDKAARLLEDLKVQSSPEIIVSALESAETQPLEKVAAALLADISTAGG